MEGIVCDWETNCFGNHFKNDDGDRALFMIEEGGEMFYPILINWIEQIAVDSILANVMGMCEFDEEMSETYGAEVFRCQVGEDDWYAGQNDEGFGFGYADGSAMLMCDNDGNCWGFQGEEEFCSENWVENWGCQEL